MPGRLQRLFPCLCALLCSVAAGAEEYVAKAVLPSPHATQAAAADARFVYAVAGRAIAKYDRATGREIALSTGEAFHLNSAVILEDKIYCAHSNFPKIPEQGDVRVLDTATMTLAVLHRFAKPPGSITWVLRRDGGWWCHFARYGKDNGAALLVRYDDDWKETARWTYPPDLVKDWGVMSLSGAVWKGDALLATGHDKKVIYQLKVPTEGGIVQWIGTIPSPFPGQGIAEDPATGGLVGIDRKKKSVVFAELEKK